MNHDPDVSAEFTMLLTRIQNLCREYVTQDGHGRQMTFASIRIAAEAMGTLADDSYRAEDANTIRKQVIKITASVDDLTNLFGSEEPGFCRVCGKPLRIANLYGGATLEYCSFCPQDILDGIREISDLTGADSL